MLGILYESDEWSDWKLAQELKALLGTSSVCMINMEDDDAIIRAASCDLLVSRVFASACFRGHEHAHLAMEMLQIDKRTKDIPLINPARAHRFEIDKYLTTKTLDAAGIAVPSIIAIGLPAEILDQDRISKTNEADAANKVNKNDGVNKADKVDRVTNFYGYRSLDQWPYPCIIKPNCGGRTTYTVVAYTPDEVCTFLQTVPEYDFIVENYIEPTKGFLTRVEVVDGKIALIVKRSVAQNGLSSYHEGSTYELYSECPRDVIEEVLNAARLLDIQFGSFDVIENTAGNFIIDANSVSNVSEDCTDLFNLDLMNAYAQALAKRYRAYMTSSSCIASRHQELNKKEL